ncbi:MAG: MBL fold metallo-hydrolase [Myxococcota bacterium]|nr:MBL fold metallo-hydrolase [Myxococcota bacterium]
MGDGQFSVTFRGVRGSIPTPASPKQIEKKLRESLCLATAEDVVDSTSIDRFIEGLPLHLKGCLGGNSACLEMNVDGQLLIFDMGTGCVELGRELMGGDFSKGQGVASIFITHTHMDHIMGLPMFGPVYIPGNKLTFHAPIPNLRQRLIRRQHSDFFPIQFEELPALISFVDLTESSVYELGNVKIRWLENDHPGRSFSYRVEYGGKAAVLSTDAEYKSLAPETLDPVLEFFDGADILVFDAQYGFTESVRMKRDWGHSSSFVGVDMALDAEVKKLALFHHEPNFDDFQLSDNLNQAKSYLQKLDPDSELEVFLAQEGTTIRLGN